MIAITQEQKICIRPWSLSDVTTIATLHTNVIDTGFISSLGEEFVRSLYTLIIQDERSFGCVAEREGRTIGFVLFASDINALYKSVLLRGGFRLASVLAWRLFSWKRIKRIIETIFYPQRMQQVTLPKSELLALAVHPNYQGQGIGGELLDRGLLMCEEKDLKQIKVCVGGERQSAMRLYQRHGFDLVQTIKHHDVTSHLLVKDLHD